MLHERGHDKERQLEAQLLQKKLKEEKARKFKAIPHPYTTDCPEYISVFSEYISVFFRI
jgi:hypothetical protein